MAGQPVTLAEIVARYQFEHQERAARELRYFAIQRTLADTIRRAGMAQGPSGKRLNHQRRIPRQALAETTRRLLRAESALAACSSFERLHAVVRERIGDIPKIGELTIYDTALRLGAYLRLEPEKVYLHAGTRVGARHVGLDDKKVAVGLDELPEPFRQLRPREVEDCLCIFKDALSAQSK